MLAAPENIKSYQEFNELYFKNHELNKLPLDEKVMIAIERRPASALEWRQKALENPGHPDSSKIMAGGIMKHFLIFKLKNMMRKLSGS
jgi:hypothetical protein